MSFNNNAETKGLVRFTAVCVTICLIWCVFYVVRLAPELTDPDCYMRMNRVLELYNGAGWYQVTISRSNAPYGENLHWTRPFDMLLLTGAFPATLLVDFKTALFWWGVIISPVLLVVLLLTIRWAAKPLMSRQGSFLVGILLLFQMETMTCFQPGRSDHHSFLILLFVLLFGFGLRMVLNPAKRWLCFAAGITGGLAIWVSPESMVIVFGLAAILCLFWIFKNSDFAEKNLYYSIFIFIMTGIGVLAERPLSNLATQEFDKISIFHLGICGFLAAFWIMAFFINRVSKILLYRSARIIFTAAGAVLSTICLLILFPKIQQSVLWSFIFPNSGSRIIDVDPRIISIWFEQIGEIQHLFSRRAPLETAVQFTGTVLVGAAFVLYLLANSEPRNKWGWVCVLILMIIYTPLAISRIRWISYAQILLMFPVAGILDRVLQIIKRRNTGISRVIKNVSAIAAFASVFLLLGLLASWIAQNGREPTRKVSLVKMCQYLNENEKWKGKSMRILANIDLGPEILYRTRHQTIGSPYNRNYRGILDTYDILTAANDDAAYKLIKQRGIQLILLNFDSPELGHKTKNKTQFYKRLYFGEYPLWLKAVELPADLPSSLKLFEIVGEN